MPTFGLGNFLYDVVISDNAAQFKFWDDEDVTNTAEVSIDAKDFPEGASGTSRQVADLAFAQCSQLLNGKRDERIKQQVADAHATKVDEEARVREAAADFLNNAQDVVTAPDKVEADGTKVYTAGAAGTNFDDSSSDKSSKK